MRLSFLSNQTERWTPGELTWIWSGSNESVQGNPFTEIRLTALMRHENTVIEAEGFYAGEGKYMIRFMPTEVGVWTYTISSNVSDWNGRTGAWCCTPASERNHGPVRVQSSGSFHYADGTRFIPFGTHAYEWHLQTDSLQKQTLNSLQRSPFNKVRMLVLPKDSQIEVNGKPLYPFEGTPEQGFDWTRPCPAYYSLLEQRVQQLSQLDIEAELILFHPGGACGFGMDQLPPEAQELYVRYVVSRLGAYRNIWWSLAYEAEAIKSKEACDWQRLGRLVQEYDCGGHLRTIQSSDKGFDYGASWITHASVRHPHVRVASNYAKQFGKPVVLEESGCEGNLEAAWGSLTAEEMVCRLWEGFFRGGFVGYGEAYLEENKALWLQQGGLLQGDSVPRINFLRSVLEEAPASIAYSSDRLDAATLEARGEYYLQYFGPHRFAYREFALPEGAYAADIIDTWHMTITPVPGRFEGRFRIELPGELYYALRLRKVSDFLPLT